MRLGIAISGVGSNMLALAQACRDGRIPADIALVASDRNDAPGLVRATELGLPTATIARNRDETRDQHDARLRAAFESNGVDCIALAGYMRILSADFVAAYAGRLLNIHPSLLPRHKGLHTHRAALAAHDREHGATVHFVVPEMDSGPIIAQAAVPVLPTDDETALAARVLAVEHRIYPQALKLVAEGRVTVANGRCLIDGRRVETFS
mgnify:CR=1 FL=1